MTSVYCMHFRLFVSYGLFSFALGLPPSGSWQDLKDHMREAGDVCYADVYRDGTGVVEYVRKEDMSFAIRKLDNTKFRSHEVSVHPCAGLITILELKRFLNQKYTGRDNAVSERLSCKMYMPGNVLLLM